MRIGRLRIRTSRGRTLKFKSLTKLRRWERVAKAVKHGWKPRRRHG